MERDDSFWCLLPTPPPLSFSPFLPAPSLSPPHPRLPLPFYLFTPPFSHPPSSLSSSSVPSSFRGSPYSEQRSLSRLKKMAMCLHVCVCAESGSDFHSWSCWRRWWWLTFSHKPPHTHTHSYTPCTPSSPPSLWCVFEPIANQVASGLVLISPSHQPH